MTTFIAIQNTYQGIEIGLFKGQSCQHTAFIHKHQASKTLIPTVQELLEQTNTALSDCSFIVANVGPSPFSTLRVVISSVNGLSFALGMPLVAVNALHAMVHQYTDEASEYTAILLNAFNKQVYGVLAHQKTIMKIGCYQIEPFLHDVATIIQKKSVKIIGNGGAIFANEIEKIIGSRAHIPSPLIEYCSLSTVVSLGLSSWQQGHYVQELMPLYLKQAI